VIGRMGPARKKVLVKKKSKKKLKTGDRTEGRRGMEGTGWSARLRVGKRGKRPLPTRKRREQIITEGGKNHIRSPPFNSDLKGRKGI